MEHLRAAFGIGTDLDDLSAVQAVLRTLLVYGSTLVLARLGSKRFLSKGSKK